MGIIWLIRHGQASFGSDNYDALSAKGIRQAECVGRHLEQANIRFDAAYSGSLQRQQETAAAARLDSHGVPHFPEPTLLDHFNEYDFMKIIDCHLPEILREDPSLREESARIFADETVFVKLFSMIFSRWVSGQHNIGGAETFEQYRERIIDGIRTVIRENGENSRVAVFTSGGVIGTLLQMVLGLAPEVTMETGWQIRNASISVFTFKGTRLTLSSFNTTAHLEAVGDPELITFR